MCQCQSDQLFIITVNRRTLEVSDRCTQRMINIIRVIEQYQGSYVYRSRLSTDFIIFSLNQPIKQFLCACRLFMPTIKIKRFNSIQYKGYHVHLDKSNNRLYLAMTKDQLGHIIKNFDYGAYSDKCPKSRGYLVYHDEKTICSIYQNELASIHQYYCLLRDKKVLRSLDYFANESLYRTIAHKYRLTKKQAYNRLKQNHSLPTASTACSSSFLSYTGEPYTLKGVRTVLREVDLLLTTDPTIHHHLKKILT